MIFVDILSHLVGEGNIHAYFRTLSTRSLHTNVDNLDKMRVLVATLSVLLTLSECNGFVSESVSARSIAPLRAAPKDAEVASPLDLRKTLTSFAVATALGWGVASGAAFASDNYADFSLPSYEAVTKAEINQNLKGDNFLFGEASKSMDR